MLFYCNWKCNWWLISLTIAGRKIIGQIQWCQDCYWRDLNVWEIKNDEEKRSRSIVKPTLLKLHLDHTVTLVTPRPEFNSAIAFSESFPCWYFISEWFQADINLISWQYWLAEMVLMMYVVCISLCQITLLWSNYHSVCSGLRGPAGSLLGYEILCDRFFLLQCGMAIFFSNIIWGGICNFTGVCALSCPVGQTGLCSARRFWVETFFITLLIIVGLK